MTDAQGAQLEGDGASDGYDDGLLRLLGTEERAAARRARLWNQSQQYLWALSPQSPTPKNLAPASGSSTWWALRVMASSV